MLLPSIDIFMLGDWLNLNSMINVIELHPTWIRATNLIPLHA